METTTETVWREIDGKLLTALLTEAFGVSGGAETQDVADDLIRMLVEHIEEGDLVCDHSVGICVCSVRSVLEEANLWLSKLRWCDECGGDGVNHSRCLLCVTGSHERTDEDWFTCDGFIAETCAKCNGKGRVPIDAP